MVLKEGFFLHESLGPKPALHYAVRGERSTGTHYLSAVLDRFTNLTALDIGWKHGFAFREDQPLHGQLVIFGIVRDWQSWVVSMYRKPWHASHALHQLDFGAFLRSPWEGYYLKGRAANNQAAQQLLLQDDRDPVTGTAFGNLLQLRNQKHRFLCGLPNRHGRVIVVKYEWLVGHETQFLELLRKELGVVTRPFQPIHHRFATQYRSFSDGPRAAPDELSDCNRDFILSQLDHAIETAFGYL